MCNSENTISKLSIEAALVKAHEHAKQFLGQGSPAQYIPELAKTDINLLGAAVTDLSGNTFGVGDSERKFTIQSVVKVITLALAMEDLGYEKVSEVVNCEGTQKEFNSLADLELNLDKRAANPMINSGAIAVCSLIKGKSVGDRIDKILQFAKSFLGGEDLVIDNKVFLSERATGDRNRAIAYLMKSNNTISGDVTENLDVYFSACCTLVSAAQLSYGAAVFAGNGRDPKTGKQLISAANARRIRGIMTGCGMYTDSVRYCCEVGVPSKSGVGGGILAAASGKMGIGVFSPALDDQSNSLAGVQIMKNLSKTLELSAI